MIKRQVPSLGTINGYSLCHAKIGRKAFTFNGTMTGLINAALCNGAKIGTKIKANFGLSWREFTIVSAPHDPRCAGHWAV